MRERILTFLVEFKKVVTRGSGVMLVPRHDTMATLSHLGITKRNLEELLLTLSVADYSCGPETDRGAGGDLWVFGRQIRGYEVYIKLKVADVSGTKTAKCISFHIAKYPMAYPCKTSE
ncbi:MAG: toxin [Desulfobulbaceae bacterium]